MWTADIERELVYKYRRFILPKRGNQVRVTLYNEESPPIIQVSFGYDREGSWKPHNTSETRKSSTTGHFLDF